MTTNTQQKEPCIYIAGRVTGTDDYMERFSRYEKNLRETFDGDVVNPVRHIFQYFKNPLEEPKDKLMLHCLNLLSNLCTHIFLTTGWEQSEGARIEKAWAEMLDLVIIEEVKK